MVRVNRNSSIINLILLFDVIGMFYCLVKSFTNTQYSYWILPLVYTFFLACTQANRKMTKGNMGAFVLNVTMSIRYVLIPVIYYATNKLSRFAKNYDHLETAIWLMLYEMVVMMIVLEISARIYQIKENNIQKEKTRYLKLQYGPVIAIVVFLVVGGMAFSYKDLSAGLRVITTGSLEQSVNTVNNNVLDIVWETLTTWLYVYLIMSEADKFETDRRAVHSTKAIIYTFVFVLLTFIQSIAFSRWYTIISATAAVACLFKIFPDYRKKFFVSIVIPSILLIILITTYKNAGYSIGETSFLDSLSDVFSTSNFDSYFAGPCNVSNAIGVKRHYSNLGVWTIFNDMLHNMPKINYIMDASKTSVYSYNESIGRLWGGSGDQIIPLVGQSVIYFGYVLAPLMGVVSIMVMRKFDYLYKSSKSYMMYLYAFAAIWFAVEPMMLNFTININWFYIRIIPFAIALSLTDRVSKKRYIIKGN